MSQSESQSHESTAFDQDADQEQNDDLLDAVQDLAEQVADLRETVDEQQETIDDLREELREEREKRARDDAEQKQRITDTEERLDDVEERLTSDRTMGSDGEEQPPDASVTPQTPLEQTVALPEEMIEEESANVQRAVFVARDLHDYTTRVPAGRAIRSSELRRVLKAGTDCRGHSQTVERVMTVLDDFGGDDVQIVERRGERRVIFEEEIADRLGQLSEEDTSHGVVTEEAV